MEQKFDIIIIGGGIVGLATAYQLSKEFSHLSIAVIEKEKELGAHQTGHNSGVLHSGLYYTPGSKKAILCLEGKEEMVTFAKENGIAHDICGKIIVATEEKELKKTIAALTALLKDDASIRAQVSLELKEEGKKFATPRRTFLFKSS
mgnify:CR=1 FL=1